MTINIKKSEDHYRADCLDLPGTPPVGLGISPEMAVACLFWRMYFEPICSITPTNNKAAKFYNWMSCLDRKKPIIVNGKVWDWPKSYKNNKRAK